MGNSLRPIVALLLIVAFVAFICVDAYAISIQPETKEGPYFEPQSEIGEPRIGAKEKAILPEEPVTLELDNDSGEDDKSQRGRRSPDNNPTTTRKREFHRKMMYR